nr:hypothetical protein 1634Bnrm2_p022 [Cryptomonas sp.]
MVKVLYKNKYMRLDKTLLKKTLSLILGTGLASNKSTKYFSFFAIIMGILKNISNYNEIKKNVYDNRCFIGNLIFLRNRDSDVSNETKKTRYKEYYLKNKKTIHINRRTIYRSENLGAELLNWIEEFNAPLFGFLISICKHKKELVVRKKINNQYGLIMNNLKNLSNRLIKMRTNHGEFILINTDNKKTLLFSINFQNKNKQAAKTFLLLARIRNMIKISSQMYFRDITRHFFLVYYHVKKNTICIYRPEINFIKMNLSFE